MVIPGGVMITLLIRYTINPNKLSDFRNYVESEQEPIRKSGGRILGYFLPTDFAGSTSEALGLIDLPTLSAYEQYRETLANDPDHIENVVRLEESGAVLSMNRSIIQRF
jgi:hypothetical protein